MIGKLRSQRMRWQLFERRHRRMCCAIGATRRPAIPAGIGHSAAHVIVKLVRTERAIAGLRGDAVLPTADCRLRIASMGSWPFGRAAIGDHCAITPMFQIRLFAMLWVAPLFIRRGSGSYATAAWAAAAALTAITHHRRRWCWRSRRCSMPGTNTPPGGGAGSGGDPACAPGFAGRRRCWSGGVS